MTQTALRQLALAFPVSWSHRRGYSPADGAAPASSLYYIEWRPGTGTFGEDWDGAKRDSGGALLMPDGQTYHPIHLAQFGLHRYNEWRRTGALTAKEDFLAQARWLRDNQHAVGKVAGLYTFDFPWPKYGAGSGWVSAMAQGEAISVLIRAEAIASGCGFGDAAVRASVPFEECIEDGGVVWRRGNDVFLEEVANSHAPHILNGCIYALWGIWELNRCSANPARERIVAQCVETLRRWLPRFDTGWWSLYSLMRSAGGRSHVATLKYHAFHIAQLHVLASMFQDEQFSRAAQRWNAYIDDGSCRGRLFFKTAVSLYDRVRRFDTVPGGAST